MQHLLVLSQVVLSLQLAFAVIPLIHFTSDRKNMGAFATPRHRFRGLAWPDGSDHRRAEREVPRREDPGGGRVGVGVGPSPGPDRPWAGGGVGLYGLGGGMAALLTWVVVKPWGRPSRAWAGPASVELDWADAAPPARRGDDRRGGRARPERRRDPQPGGASLARPGPDEARAPARSRHADEPRLQAGGHGRPRDGRRLAVSGRGCPRPRAEGLCRPRAPARGPTGQGELVHELRREPVDLLIVGSHGHGLVRDLLFGQTVDKRCLTAWPCRCSSRGRIGTPGRPRSPPSRPE